MKIEYKSKWPAVRSIADVFNDVYGIENVEPTANGVWFESRRHKNGKLRARPKLLFATKTQLRRLLEEVEELGEDKA